MSRERQHNRNASCEGKVRFRSMKQAKRIVRRWRRGGDHHAMPYHCEHCHGFHLGLQLGGSRINKRPRVEITDEEAMA